MTETALTTQENLKLKQYEAIIKHGLRTFVDVGNALLGIREERLYRDKCKTFAEYCQVQWRVTDRRARHMMDAAQAVANIESGTTVPLLPTNEAQARPLTRLEPEQQQEAWARVVEENPDGKITGAKVQEVVDRIQKPPREKKPEPEPLPVDKSPRLIVSRAEDMPEVEDESIDLIITSPPYNLGGNNWPMGGNGREPRTDGIGYTDDLDELAYQDWQVQCLIEFYRVAKPGASLFYNHKVRNVQGQIVHPMDWLRDEHNQWIIRQEIIWDRGSTHNHNAMLFWPEDERIYWMTKGSPTLPARPVGMSSVWSFHGPVAGTWHPAPFSEELPKRCIEAVGRGGITVLDPFAGRCTTCKVALGYRYEAVGVDVSQEYLERAAKENGWMMQSAI